MELFIITGIISLLASVIVLTILTLTQRAHIKDLECNLSRMIELYMLESRRKIEKMQEEIFKDDMEFINH